MDCTTLSLHGKTNYWPKLPIELHHTINDYLSVYDNVNLSSANHFLRRLFFTVALRPGYKKYLENAMTDYENTLTGKICFLMANLALYFNDPSVIRTMSNKEIFYAVERCRKPKYLVCDQERLTFLKLDSHLMKTKIANGEVENIELIRDSKLVEAIQSELQSPITEVQKDNLNSTIIQDCIFIGFLNIAEAKNLSEYARRTIELKCVQREIGNNRLAKQTVLSFGSNTFITLKLVNETITTGNELLPTINEAILYPVQTRALIKHPAIFKAVLNNEIKKETVFALRRDQIMCFEANFTDNLPARMVAICLNWIQHLNLDDVKTLNLNWVKWKNVQEAEQILSKKKPFLDIEEKYGNQEQAIEAYFQNIWHGKVLCSPNIFRAASDTIRILFLSELGEQKIAPLVRKGIISVDDILRCDPEKLDVLGSNNLAEWALENGYLKGTDLIELSSIELNTLLTSLDIPSVQSARKKAYLTNQDIQEISAQQIIEQTGRRLSEHENYQHLVH